MQIQTFIKQDPTEKFNIGVLSSLARKYIHQVTWLSLKHLLIILEINSGLLSIWIISGNPRLSLRRPYCRSKSMSENHNYFVRVFLYQIFLCSRLLWIGANGWYMLSATNGENYRIYISTHGFILSSVALKDLWCQQERGQQCVRAKLGICFIQICQF